MFSTKRILLIKKCLTSSLDVLTVKNTDPSITDERRAQLRADFKDIKETLEDLNIIIERHKTQNDE